MRKAEAAKVKKVGELSPEPRYAALCGSDGGGDETQRLN